MRGGRYPILLLVVGLILLAASAVDAYSLGTWTMEVFPIFIALPILAATYRRFPFTPLVYTLIFMHACILMVGGHYTYARVPFGFWMQRTFHFARNHYDRIGHFAQGFVPALVAREVLLRRTPLRRGGWLFYIVSSICLAISAGYEFVEWWSAEIGGAKAEDFLGTQGDPWDTQWDMLFALIGSIVAQVSLAGIQDRQIAGNPTLTTHETGRRIET